MKTAIYNRKTTLQDLLLTLPTICLLFFASCSKEPQLLLTEVPAVKEEQEEEKPKTSQPGVITVEVTFNSAPATASSTFAPLKYNKTSVINFEFDDNPTNAYHVYQSLKTRTFSDGTGKQVKFTAASAVNSRGNYNNGDLWENYQGNLTRQQAIEMISDGWILANHGYYHSVLNSKDNFGFGKPIAENISDNTKTVFEKTGFKMRTLVVPSNDAGYLAPAFDQGIIATSSTNSFDGFQSFPLYGDYVDISLLPAKNIHLRRDFNDRWDDAGLNSIKAKLTTLFNKSNEKERMLYRLGTHMPDVKTFNILADHITNASQGNCWVTTTQELIEYLQTKNVVVKQDAIIDGKLVITLDVSRVDKDTYFKDFTLLVNSGASIKNISVNNARYSSSNSETGLINIGF